MEEKKRINKAVANKRSAQMIRAEIYRVYPGAWGVQVKHYDARWKRFTPGWHVSYFRHRYDDEGEYHEFKTVGDALKFFRAE